MNKTGFGYLRLPRLDPADEKSVDFEKLNAMTDRFLELGGRYFDTAYTYLGGMSEEALRISLVERHERGSFVIADKLPGYKVKQRGDCRRFFEESRRRCGVEYFDVYLLHWLNARNYEIAEQFDEFGFLEELRREGLALKTGFSYHDGPQLLDKILTAHPEIDYVQLQINYLDWDSASIQARECYETAVRHGKKVIVMEPVKGGTLASLPEQAAALMEAARPGESAASWAVRFAASLENVEVVLSGMSAMEQVEDNMRPMQALTEGECEVLRQAAEKLRADIAVACTGCGYCMPHCPVNMPIPAFFAMYNEYARKPAEGWKMEHAYQAQAAGRARASECLKCGLCAQNCPQKLDIPGWLEKTAGAFEG